MNRDDSDLSSLSDEDDYQGDIGSEMDNDDEDQDLTEDENDEPPSKRLAFHIKQLISMILDTCLKWLWVGIIEVGAGMRSARP
ncbi:hypothetical protein TNCV_4146831 [Trichonephila clavipes]|nr:hypothetical protein TNCV_4146831 [Trichonephila clavipes]